MPMKLLQQQQKEIPMETSDQIKEDNGSRDRTRKFLKEAQELLIAAADEISKLRVSNKRDVAYRYADADLGICIATLEKVKIVMRKRKRTEKQIVVTNETDKVPDAPLGD